VIVLAPSAAEITDGLAESTARYHRLVALRRAMLTPQTANPRLRHRDDSGLREERAGHDCVPLEAERIESSGRLLYESPILAHDAEPA
jgi:hypothetical protein